jgi:uncharacterized membrane protein YphA (DoxX/SURF4 family)
MNAEAKLNRTWWALRLGLGTMAFAAGADKFFDLLVNWNKYLAPQARRSVPMRSQNFMKLVGAIEMLVGLGILTRNTRLSSYAASGWLAAIAGQLIVSGDYFDIAVRDVELAIAAFALGQLTEIREQNQLAGRRELRRVA